MELERALEYAAEGEALLFVGSGFSQGALNKRGGALLKGRELARLISSHVEDLPEDTALDDAAEEFVEMHGESKLIELLKSEFLITEVGPPHLSLAKCPWRRIYTTNYDNIVELAGVRVGRPIKPITLSDNAYEQDQSKPQCVHLNGYVHLLTEKTLWSEFKLLESSYLSASIAESPWSAMFRADVEIARAVFFVGYSLSYDLDIKRILFEMPALREKTFFILGDGPSSQTLRRVKKFGTDLRMGVEAFSDLVASSLETTPRRKVTISSISFVPYEAAKALRPLQDNDVFDLLLYGKVVPGLLVDQAGEVPKYYLWRREIDRALEVLSEGTAPIVVHSSLGNGKTMFLEGLKLKARSRGFDVFSLREASEVAKAELQQIFDLARRPLIILEEYPDHLDLIKFFALRAPDQARLVLSARSLVHDIEVDSLCDALGSEDVVEIEVERLRDDEIEWAVKFLDSYGLWGKDAGLGRTRKLDLIKNSCRGEWHAILLRILNSPDISERFSGLLNSLRERSEHHEILVSILVMATINKGASFSNLLDLWGVEKFGRASVRKDRSLRQLIDFQGGAIKLRSSVAAQFT